MAYRVADIALEDYKCKAAELMEYRLKPTTIRIGEYDVPEPLREAIRGQIVYLANPHAESGNTQLSYAPHWEPHRNWLRDGFFHATQEAAILHSKALISLTARGDVYE